MADVNISVFKTVKDQGSPINYSLFKVLDMIRNPNKHTLDLLKRVRSSKDKDKRDAIKIELPVYTFAGTFTKRENAGIENYSGIIVIDFDGVENPQELKKKIQQDPYTFVAYLSPSGRGVKVLVQTNNKEPQLHRRYVEAIQEYYNKYAPVDPQGSGLCMGAYASYDPDLYIDPCADEWTDPKEEVTSYNCGWKDPGNDERNFALTITSQEELYQKAVEFISKYEVFTEGNRDKFIFRLASECNKLGISNSGLAERIAVDFGNSKGFGLKDIQKCVRSGYKKTAEHGSVKLKDVTRYKAIREMRAKAVPVDKIIQEVKKPRAKDEHPIEDAQIGEVLDELENENPKGFLTFWSTFQKNPEKPESPFTITISRYKFLKWLEKLGVRVFYPLPDRTGDYIFVRMRNNIVRPVESTFFQNQARKHIESLPAQVDFVTRDQIMEQFLREIVNTTNTKNLAAIEIQDINFHRDTKEAAFFYFRNGIIRITRDNIELIGYEQVDLCIWESKIRKTIIAPPGEGELPTLEDYLLMGRGNFDFGDWLYKTAGGDMANAKAICAALGYLCHNYSDPANPKAVVLLETPLNGKAEGGTGKGILTQAVEQMRTVIKENGKVLDLGDKFWLQGLQTDTDVFCIDDIDPRKFNFENLFSILTEGVPVERKHQNKIYIRPEESPKFIMTSNYPFRDTGHSGDRRRYEVELSHNFKVNYGTPFEYYGKLFFRNDWSPGEWQLFYYFMFECVRYYMRLDGRLESVPSTPLAIRKLLADTNNKFVEFASTFIQLDKWYSKSILKDKYNEKYHTDVTTQWITSSIKAYARFLNCVIEESVKENQRSILLKSNTEITNGAVSTDKLNDLRNEIGLSDPSEENRKFIVPLINTDIADALVF